MLQSYARGNAPIYLFPLTLSFSVTRQAKAQSKLPTQISVALAHFQNSPFSQSLLWTNKSNILPTVPLEKGEVIDPKAKFIDPARVSSTKGCWCS